MSLPKGYKYTSPRKPRYYKTPYNESLKRKDIFTVPETQEFVNAIYNACDEYCKTHSESQKNGYTRVLGEFILSLGSDFDVKTIDGKYLVDFYDHRPGNKLYVTPFTKNLIFQLLSMNKAYQWHEELDAIANAIFPLWNDIQNIQNYVIPFLSGDKDPTKCRLFKANSIMNGNPVITAIEFDTDNRFIQDLLLDYHQLQHDVQPRVYQLSFYERFAESLDYELPSDIYGFNVDTLLKQERFFSSIRREPELENRFFYRYILKKQGDSKTITIADGVSIGYLMSEGFAKNFINGFRYVPLNPNEDYPEFDKWAVSPNGLEQKTTVDKPEHIRYVDFSKISDETIRDAAKAWFWGESKAGFENRYRSILYIIEFFRYRDQLRSMYFDKLIQARTDTDLDIKNTVLSEEIISYTSEWGEKLTDQSYRTRIVPLKLFLQYTNENNIYKTEIAAFEYLNTSNKGTKIKQEIPPVSKDHFQKMIEVLENKAKGNNLHMLYYIVFCLNTLTPLRISSILDMDYDCVVEKSKGIYAVEVKVKTSNGDEKSIQISKEVKRLVDVAISLTTDTRVSAPDDLKHYLFLVNNQKDFYRSIPQKSYIRHLQRCCSEAGIPLYSAQNLRKTYYTNLVENALKKNVSIFSLKELTAHSNVDTTENYYVKENIRNYLEATMGVEIGNMPIAGTVVAEYSEAKHGDIVNDGCGYCRNPECNVLGTANCLMCKGFITTPEHITQFEEAIAVLIKQITDNENLHDKEHLYAVKRLYVAYLEQLYIRKDEMNDVASN